MLISEIFTSIDGESKRAGELATFVRSVGCNLRCEFCFGPNKNGKYPKVTMADLTKKPINEVTVGDEILTLNDNKEIVVTTVTNFSSREVTKYEMIHFPEDSLIVTPEHPFYVDGNWKNAEELVEGDICYRVSDREYALFKTFNSENLKTLADINASHIYPVMVHTASYGDRYTHQVGQKPKTVIGISCSPYNTYLINDIYVHNCDSKYTWQADATARNMTVDEIVEDCLNKGVQNVTFTGGEPLIQKDADELINKLADKGFDVGIETDGAVDFTERDWFIDNKPGVWVCADYKCYASGMTDRMLPIETFRKLRPQDVLKFVVGSEKDLQLAYEMIIDLRAHGCDCYFYLSPVFGMIEPVDIVNFMLERQLQHKIRFQLQLHKFVWDPNMRGV